MDYSDNRQINGIILIDAIQWSNFIHVKNLVYKNADIIRFTDENAKTPLHHASFNGNLEIVKFLLSKGANPNVYDNCGWSPLHISAKSGHIDIVKCLIENGAIIDSIDFLGNTPLLDISNSEYINIVKLLIDKGADVKVRNIDGETPLHLTAEDGIEDVVTELIKNGADVNARDNYGWTPLHCAIVSENINMVNILLNNNANSLIKSKTHIKPIDLGDDENIKTLLRNAEKEQYIKMSHLFLKLLKSKYDLSILTYFEITKNYSENILNKDEILKIIKIN